MPTDHDLMLSVRSGDIEKLGLLFEKYHKQLYNFFLLYTKNRQAGEDLVHDVFFRMLKYRYTYRDKANFTAWMFKIDYFRKHSVKEEPLIETDDLISNDLNPEDKYLHKRDIDFLRKALAELSEDKREVIIMRRFNNMRYKEIGKVLDCKVGTVKVRIYRAMKELTKIYFKLAGEKSYEM